MRIAPLIAAAVLVFAACSKDDDKKADDSEETATDDEATPDDEASADDEATPDDEASGDDEAAATDDEDTATDDEDTAADDEDTAADDEDTAADDEPVERATSAEGSIEEFKAWADEVCACENPECLNAKISGFKKLFDKYGHLQGAEAEAIGKKAGVHAGRGMNCFVQGGGDQAKLQEIMQMLQ